MPTTNYDQIKAAVNDYLDHGNENDLTCVLNDILTMYQNDVNRDSLGSFADVVQLLLTEAAKESNVVNTHFNELINEPNLDENVLHETCDDLADELVAEMMNSVVAIFIASRADEISQNTRRNSRPRNRG